jgi:hypothetical protein
MALDDEDLLPGLDQPTVLIAVMKNGAWLDHLRRLLSQLDLTGVPTLIIDDEADQASLNNNVTQGTESATYRRILALRDLIPHHTFLQYTATPQALLLINIIDVLSPNFAEVLTAGPTYTGAEAFFGSGLPIPRLIPPADVPTASSLLLEPPESLLEAMRVFFVGVAAGMREGQEGNRSMMVHPSNRTMRHADYMQWVRGIQDLWGGILAGPEPSEDRNELLDQFREAHADLAVTVPDIATFEELTPYLKPAVRRTVPTLVNAVGGHTPQPEWRQIYSHILVGGEVLNRGYTIEGLTVSYMPRGPGMNQADTIEQRARWFGHKAGYLGYCRVYLPEDILQFYSGYVDHESRLREQLRQYRADLRQWRRAFFLDPGLRPTRDSVIGLEPVRGSYSDSWWTPKAPHDSDVTIQFNRGLVTQLVSRLEHDFVPDEGDPRRTDAQRHTVAVGISLRMVYEEFLTRLRAPRDSVTLTGLLLQVGRYLDSHPDATCSIYRMSGGRSRERSVDEDDEIPTLHQGANFDRSKRPPEMTYPGDDKIRTDADLTIQIHTLQILAHETRAPLVDDVPAIAVWIPQSMEAGWVSQPQGGD